MLYVTSKAQWSSGLENAMLLSDYPSYISASHSLYDLWCCNDVCKLTTNKQLYIDAFHHCTANGLHGFPSLLDHENITTKNITMDFSIVS